MKIRLMFLSVFFMFALATLAFSSFGVGQAHAAALDGAPMHQIQNTSQPEGHYDGGDGGMGVFQPVYDALAPLARNLWAFLVAIIIILASLGGLYFAMQGTGGVILGGTKPTASAIMGLIGLVVVVLIVFLLLPNLGTMLKSFQPKPPF